MSACKAIPPSYLMCNIWSGITNVATHLAHDTNVFVAVQQGVLFILGPSPSAVNGLVRLQASIGQDDNQSLGVLVSRGNGHVLLRDELGKCWGWE